MNFEEEIRKDLHRFLRGVRMVDERLPETIDIENFWPSIEEAYLPDGVREFAGYPVVSLGWIMFVGMAVAKCWDRDYQGMRDEGGAAFYRRLRDAEGYDMMDEYILGHMLGKDAAEAEKTSKIVGECAARVYHHLQRNAEPGTEQAVRAYEAALRQLYLFGAAMELNALGYHMQIL